MTSLASLLTIPITIPFHKNNKCFFNNNLFNNLSYSNSITLLTTTLYYPYFYASSTTITKTRASRKVKSDAELCNDIRKFISVVGLPEGHVPSMKELSQHGRQDLAYIVRRRGYKLIKKLLATSIKSDGNGTDRKEGLTDLHDAGGKDQYELIGQEQKVNDMIEGVLLSAEVPTEHNHFESTNVQMFQNGVDFDCRSNIALESSLQNKVANFIENGELDSVADDGFDISHVIGVHGGNDPLKSVDLPKHTSPMVKGDPEWDSGIGKTSMKSDGSLSKKEQVVLHASNNGSPGVDVVPDEGQSIADFAKESDIEIGMGKNTSEVNRLKFILHQKDLELSQLKKQIEKEKLALSHLHIEAEKEISKAHKLISEKDTELLAAEEILLDLKEVQVQYMGDGETVQVAGSFNGWHHPVKMDPQPSSMVDPTKSRNSRLWSTVLWLYPGAYEIKFIIDGHWRIDPQRETLTVGTIQNNVLRVDR